MSASSYQREVVRLRAQLRDVESKLAAEQARSKAAGARLVEVTTERDSLRSERSGEHRDSARLAEVMADQAELEIHRLDAWQDVGDLEPGEDPPAAGWPEQVADPELYVAQALGLARTTYVPRAAPPPPPQRQRAADEPGAIERHLGDRAALHLDLVNGGRK